MGIVSRSQGGGGSGTGFASLLRKTTAKDVTNTVVETDLLNGEITIPANVMGVNGVARATLLGDFLNNAAAETLPVFRIKLGATTLLDIPSASDSAPALAATRRPFYCQFDIHNLGATNSQYMAGHIYIGSSAAPTTGLGAITIASAANGFSSGFATSAAVAVDTTAAQVLAVTVQWATATVTRSWRLQSAVVEVHS